MSGKKGAGKMSALKPCPWCGQMPKVIENETCGFAYFCESETHYCETAWYKTEEEARAAWNYRG